jgi:hypothetical protein
MKFAYGLALMLVALGAGCTQGVGERCQIDRDCDDGLICSTAGLCQEPVNVGTADASLPDGSLLDVLRPDVADGPDAAAGTIDAAAVTPDAADTTPDATVVTPDAAAPTADADLRPDAR